MVTPATAPRLVAVRPSATDGVTTRRIGTAANAGHWQAVPVADWYAPWLSWPTVMTRTLMDMQQAQLAAWAVWQRSCWSLGQQGWAAWNAQLAGGVPIAD